MNLAALLILLSPLFEDATQPCGLENVKGDRFSFADIDADGDCDLIVGGRRLFLNEKGRFAERPESFPDAKGSSAACADFDGDGRLDVLTLGGTLFLQTKAGAFRRSELAFPERQASFGVGDVDGDGLPDVVTGGGERWDNESNSSILFPRRLLINRGGGTFEDATERMGFGSKRYGRSVVFCDFDDDGAADFFVGNYRLAPNELWLGGAKGLQEAGEARDCRGLGRSYEGSPLYFGHTIGASWADLDNDGWIDLWVSNLVHKYVGPTNHPAFKDGQDMRGEICDDSNLYRNGGPPEFRFEDRRATSGIPLKPKGARGVFKGDELWSNCACADFDNDGDLDVFVTQVYTLPYAGSRLYRNLGNFTFEEVDPGFRIFASYGAAWGDVDGDGRLDLITGGALGKPDGPKAVRLWRNVSESGNWIAFRLDKPLLGVVVRLITDRGVLTRQSEACMGSHTQQNTGLLHFGLGDRKIEEVRICWPDGSEQRLARVPKTGKVHVLKRKISRRLGSVALTREGNALVCKLLLRGAQFHWDLDDDFVTDKVTKSPRLELDESIDPTRACVRVFVGEAGVKARLQK